MLVDDPANGQAIGDSFGDRDGATAILVLPDGRIRAVYGCNGEAALL